MILYLPILNYVIQDNVKILKKIFENNYRLDASAYDFDVLNALDLIEKNKNGFIPVTDLFSQNYVGNRFKRIYTEKRKAVQQRGSQYFDPDVYRN